MKLEHALKWLKSHEACRGTFGLHRMEYLMEKLENPHHDYASVLIGGTNGKGSVTSLLESIVSVTPDYQTGATISPHLIDLRERVRLQSESLPDTLWLKGIQALEEPVKIMSRESSLGAPSYFELVTALAFWAFRESERDLVFLEVGLGGRLDPTNVAHSEISIITNIGTDHQEFLGPDRPSIAREKLGIVKRKGVLLTTERDPEILQIFETDCKEKKAQLIALHPNQGFKVLSSHPKGYQVQIDGHAGPLEFPLPGRHQLDNLALALGAIERLRRNGFDISPEVVAKGIQNVSWPGRLQWIPRHPPVLLDGAHNQEGLQSLLAYLREFPLPRPAHLILGVLNQKPAREMAVSLAPHVDSMAFVPPHSGRALTMEDFVEQIQSVAPAWKWCANLAEALSAGQSSNSILLTGSLYLVADYLRLPKQAKTETQ